MSIIAPAAGLTAELRGATAAEAGSDNDGQYSITMLLTLTAHAVSENWAHATHKMPA